MFWVGSIVMVGIATWTLWSVRRDYQRGRELSPVTVVSVWAFYLVHLGLVLYAVWNRLLPLPLPRTGSLLLGLLMAAAGTVVYVLGILHLRSLRRMSGVDTSQLITDGIYSWSRNPQNLGWWLFLMGLGLLARSGVAILLALLFWLMSTLYVPMEERHLESLYGEKYRDYKRTSHRFFGPPMPKGESRQ